MSVTPFLPTTSAGPPRPAGSSGPNRTAPTGRADRSDAAGTASSGESENAAGEETLDDFLATLSTALAAVATTSAGVTEPVPTAAPPRTDSTPDATPGAVPGVAPGPTTPSRVPDVTTTRTAASAAPDVVATSSRGSGAHDLATPPPRDTSAAGDRPVASQPSAAATSMSVVGAGAQPTMPTATPTHAAPIGLVDVAGPVDRTEPGDGTGHASAGTSGPGDVSSPVTAVDGSSAASVSVAGSPVAAPGARTRGETTTAVLRQVFPEVTRVATQAGPGTHRLSLTLHPETLGEVKVTLVVRAGTVHVSLAAGTGVAHDALLQGAPELRRLLEVTGGDARVVVRDSTSSGSPASSAAISTATTADQHDADGRGQQAPYAPSAGDGRASRDGQDRRDGRTTSAAVGEPASLPGARPRNPRGAGQTRTAVHPGRLDRLM